MEKPVASISFEDFLIWEQQQEGRHEFVAGTVLAFSGGSLDHDKISGNIYVALTARLQPPCRAYGSNVITETVARKGKNGPRADVVVTCSSEDVGAALSVKCPRIVFEVLSPSNTGQRWTAKAFEYWNTRSIEQFVTVDAAQRSVESFSRDEAGMWLPVVALTGAATLALPSVDIEISLDEIYRGTALQDFA